MPGYIIHLSEAEMILSALRKKGWSFDENYEDLFFLGALLPDTKIKREKVTSHFWREEDLDKLAIPPVLRAFEEKYKGRITGPVMLGYWAHLHLDELFVNEFWPSMMTFIGVDGKEKILKSEITSVWLKERKEMIPLEAFFTSEYYYGDYDRTNQLFYHRFNLHIPKMHSEISCPVEEVQTSDLNRVLGELSEMVGRDRTGDMELRVFSEERLVEFLERTAQAAADNIWKGIV